MRHPPKTADRERCCGGSLPVKRITVGFLAVLLVVSAGYLHSEAEQRPNIILIVVDALRPDHLGCYGYARPTSPNIDSLASGGVVFETAITHAPWTKVSFPSFLTSLYPFQHGISNWESILPDSLLTMAEYLKTKGYSTACAVQHAVLAPKFNTLQGFDIIEPLILWREGATKVRRSVLESIDASPEPFFIMAHFFDAHKPYNMPEKYVDLVREDEAIEPYYHWNELDFVGIYNVPAKAEIEGNLLLYDACIRFADDEIGRILHYLDEQGLVENTLVIVTADHGEAFWEHGLPLHSTNVYDEALKVPLIFHYPRKWEGGKRVEGQVRLIDMFPTVADLVGGDIPSQCEGSSLVDFVDGGERIRQSGSFLPVDMALTECTTYAAPATRSLRTDDCKLICESLSYTFEFYDLEEDPGETANIFGTGHAKEDSLLGLIHKVPTLRFRGWRLAFTGKDEGSAYRAEVKLADGGHFRTVKVITRPGGVGVDLNDDSTSCVVTTEGPGAHVILLDSEPQSAGITFTPQNASKVGSPVFYVGQTGKYEIGERVTPSTLDGLGPPSDFETCRRSGIQAAHAWWLPGARLTELGEKTVLTDEEKVRLKALGYIQ
jgi:arylsulfatase A-like enzyme